MVDSDRQSDAELLQATATEVEAFGVFYRRHVDWVLGFLAHRLGDAELAADVTSEVFAAALLSASRYDATKGEPGSWLYGIACHKLSSAVRRGAAERRARRRLGMGPVAVQPNDIEWIESLARAGQGQVALGLLHDLPDDQRRVLTARVLDEREYGDIAAEHAIPPSTVRKRVSRGLAALRAQMREREPSE
jgi:RNA polymerase sigma-70 factor (ECF subfamily)